MFVKCMLLALSLFSFQAHLKEVDNLTHRDQQLRDSRTVVNKIVNDYFKEVVPIANQKKSCADKTFLIPLAKRIGTGFVSAIEREIERDASVDQVFTKRKKSIYRDFNFLEAPGMFVVNFSSLINVNGFIIGNDKLGHFLGTGFSYYQRVYLRGQTLEQALIYGEKTERTYYGLMLNGVYSYADLAANLDGLKFWERVIGFGDDLNLDPYVRCENRQWSLNATFDIADYINPAWDEAINTSTYKNHKMHTKVARQITALEQKHGALYTSMLTQKHCDDLVARYGDAAKHVITPACFAK